LQLPNLSIPGRSRKPAHLCAYPSRFAHDYPYPYYSSQPLAQ